MATLILTGALTRVTLLNWQALSPHNHVQTPFYKKPGFEWCTAAPLRKVTRPYRVVLRPELAPYFGGNGVVSGISEIGTLPVKCRVRIYECSTGLLIREQWSGTDGTYAFTGMKKGIEYTVTAVDPSRTYNDVIAARVTAV